jgi:hypothetical protein
MIISEAEIRRCIDTIDSSGAAVCSGFNSASPSERSRLAVYRQRLENIPARPNDRLGDVKRAVAERHYLIGSAAVAEKLLGRVISDKVR